MVPVVITAKDGADKILAEGAVDSFHSVKSVNYYAESYLLKIGTNASRSCLAGYMYIGPATELSTDETVEVVGKDLAEH